jgi:transposase InsO family protein
MDKFLRPERFDADPASPTATQEWRHWLRTLENFMASVASAKPDKLTVLTNHVSASIYTVIADCSSYDDAIKALTEIYDKPKNEIFARHLLATRRQQSSETIDQFLQALRGLSKECNFKAVSAEKYCDEAIRDVFITGLASHHIRQRLLENSKLDLSSAVTQARALEMAQKNSELYPSQSFQASVNATQLSNKDSAHAGSDGSQVAAATRTLCYFCGNSRHPRTACPAREVVCHKCNKKGHFAKVCQSSKLGNVSAAINQSVLAALSPTVNGLVSRATLDTVINGNTLSALVDTGSSDNFIKESVARQLSLKVFPTSGTITLASTAHRTLIKGYCLVSLSIKGELYHNIKLLVLENLCCDLLLGHDFMRLHKNVSIKFGGDRPTLSVCNLIAMSIQPPALFSNLSANCRPIAVPSRRHCNDDRQFISLEVQQLLREGIIEPSDSPWRAQVLVTKNTRQKKRLVIDYSQTINKFTHLNAYPLPRIDDLVQKIACYRVFSALDLKSAYHQIPIRLEDKPYTAFEADGRLYQFCRLPFGLTNAVSCFQKVINEFIQEHKLEGVYAYLDDVLVCGTTYEEHDTNLQKFKDAAHAINITFNESKCHYRESAIHFLGYLISDGQIKPDPDRLQPLRDLQLPTGSDSLRRAIGLFAYYSQWIPNYSDRAKPLLECRTFPLDDSCAAAFEGLKLSIENAVLTSIDESLPFVVETDASDNALAGTLSQNGRPVAFFSRSLSKAELRNSSVEKEAAAIIESVRRWRHYLTGRHFVLITDQRSVSFMFDCAHKSKIKNDKITRWRVELACYSYDIVYRPGRLNVAADALSRATCASTSTRSLSELHSMLCHPGVRRLLHFVKSKNLPYSTDEVRQVCSACKICAQLKPRFCSTNDKHLIKATQPFERLSMDFVGPKPSVTANKYLLVLVDEFSRFPFVFPCSDMSTATVIKCLRQLFSLFGMPAYIHSDRGTQFMSAELSSFLTLNGVSQSRTTPYNPAGNGQCERYNGTIWKTIQLTLKEQNLPDKYWESVLPEVLHAVRSLLCTATNATPHERFFSFTRRSSSGSSIPSWLTNPGSVLLKRHARSSKSDPLVEEVELILATPNYAHIQRRNGVESTVSLRDLAPLPRIAEHCLEPIVEAAETEQSSTSREARGFQEESPRQLPSTGGARVSELSLSELDSELLPLPTESSTNSEPPRSETSSEPLRRSKRKSIAPDRLVL